MKSLSAAKLWSYQHDLSHGNDLRRNSTRVVFAMTTNMVRAYINLTPEDKATLERAYGYGWSIYVRELIHDQCVRIRNRQQNESTNDDD